MEAGFFFPSRDRLSNEKFLVLEMHQNGHSHHLCGVHPQSMGNCVGGFGGLVNEFIRHSRVEENTGSLSEWEEEHTGMAPPGTLSHVGLPLLSSVVSVVSVHHGAYNLMSYNFRHASEGSLAGRSEL